MQLIYQCPVCQLPNSEGISAETRKLTCTSQDWSREISTADIEDDSPKRCLCCGNEDLWRQKDFPQALGLLMVVAGIVLSTIAVAYYEIYMIFITLLAFAAIDMVLYAVMKDVLVCYRCSARHRKAKIHDDHPRFNLELNERYRQEEIRLAEAEKSSQ
jgi:hypothetical protein